MKPSFFPTDGSYHSERLLLLLYHLYTHSHETEFELRSLILPWRFPRTSKTASWEAFRTYWCLTHLEEIGVKIETIHLNPAYFTTSIDTQFVPTTSLDPQTVLTTLTTPMTEGLHPDGRGVFHMVEAEEKLLIAPAFFKLTLSIHSKGIKGWLNAYLASYRKDILSHQHPTFGLTFTRKLFRKILNALKYRQGSRVSLNLSEKGRAEILHIFRTKFSHEFALWDSGQYDLFFWHYLIHLSFRKILKLAELDFSSPGLSEGHHETPYQGQLRLELLTPKSRSYNPFHKQLKTIEVTPTKGKQFLVYLNEAYTHPIPFSSSIKSGELLYLLATDGYAPFKPFARAYEYISSDKRFKLFSQSTFSFTKILERDEDGYIIPAEGITFQLKSE